MDGTPCVFSLVVSYAASLVFKRFGSCSGVPNHEALRCPSEEKAFTLNLIDSEYVVTTRPDADAGLFGGGGSSSFELILSLLASLLFEQVNYPICMRVCSRWTVFQTHTPKGGRKMFFQFEFVFACVAREVRKEG